MSTHGDSLKSRFVPTPDAAATSLDAQAITSATNYDGDMVDLGSAYNGGAPALGMWFVPSSTLAGGTSLQYILLSDADGVAGSEVVELTSRVHTLAAGYEPVCVPIPQNLGKRYVKARVTSLGVHTAGTVTAFVAPLN